MFDTATVHVEVTQTVFHKADLPDLVVDLVHSHSLTAEHTTSTLLVRLI